MNYKKGQFAITDQPLESWIAQHTPVDPRAGACATFEGRVRNHNGHKNGGQSVDALTYEIFIDLAQPEGEKILAEAMETFDILDAAAVHRHGRLAIGEAAVWVAVIAAHRKEAFAACQYIIDEIKHRLPIWKKEHYTTGESVWVNCQQCSQHREPAHAAR